MNTKFVSSNVLKIKLLIFSTHEMKFVWYLPKKSKFGFNFFRKIKGKIISFSPSHFSFSLLASACLVGIILEMVYTVILINE